MTPSFPRFFSARSSFTGIPSPAPSPNTLPSERVRPVGSVFKTSPANSKIFPRTSFPAMRMAFPMWNVVRLEAVAWSKGVISVSGLGIEMEESATPMVSAAIWARTVFCPAPISTELVRRIVLPSPFTLMTHHDSVGVTVPLSIVAIPLPRNLLPDDPRFSPPQPISRLAFSRVSLRPTACKT